MTAAGTLPSETHAHARMPARAKRVAHSGRRQTFIRTRRIEHQSERRAAESADPSPERRSRFLPRWGYHTPSVLVGRAGARKRLFLCGFSSTETAPRQSSTSGLVRQRTPPGAGLDAPARGRSVLSGKERAVPVLVNLH